MLTFIKLIVLKKKGRFYYNSLFILVFSTIKNYLGNPQNNGAFRAFFDLQKGIQP